MYVLVACKPSLLHDTADSYDGTTSNKYWLDVQVSLVIHTRIHTCVYCICVQYIYVRIYILMVSKPSLLHDTADSYDGTTPNKYWLDVLVSHGHTYTRIHMSLMYLCLNLHVDRVCGHVSIHVASR